MPILFSQKKRAKLFAAFFLVIAFTISSTACGKRADIIPEHVNELNQENAQIQFGYLTKAILQQELSANTLNLHYMAASPAALGVSEYAVSLGHYGINVQQEALQTIKDYQAQLKKLDYDSLSPENQITYDVMDWYFEKYIAAADFPYYEEPLNQTIGVQSQLPILLAEYQFRETKEIEEYLNLLSCFSEYLKEIITYEQEKSTAGLFMADFAADDVIASCQAFLNDTQNHYLITSFEEKLDAFPELDAAQTADYCERNKKILNEQVFPAYQSLIDALTHLKGSGANTGGLCHFENGKDYYEKNAQLQIGTNHSVAELSAKVDNQIQTDLKKLSEILSQNGSILENLNNLQIETTDPEQILTELQEKITADFPAAPACAYQIKTVEPKLQPYLSPAFYLTPPIDKTDENTIYINPAFTSDSVNLFTTLAHEGFPGHMYQNLYTSSCQNNPVRSLFTFRGYSEGYATYAEHISYSYLGFEPAVNELLSCSGRITLGLYARLDIGIHYDGWGFDEVNDFLIKYGITETDTVRKIYQTIIEQPCNYLIYYAGMLEILDLRAMAQENDGERFSLIEFHHYLLSMGDAPFPVLEKYLR